MAGRRIGKAVIALTRGPVRGSGGLQPVRASFSTIRRFPTRYKASYRSPFSTRQGYRLRSSRLRRLA
jgi:hypothetical protein